jgi:hypothetical protein
MVISFKAFEQKSVKANARKKARSRRASPMRSAKYVKFYDTGRD